MAKVVGPLQSTEARGGIGALIFNTWRGIATVKSFTSPAQPRSARQLKIRALMTTYSRGWQALTSVQRDGWNTWAADHPVSDWTGQPVRMTGQNAYVMCNVLLADQGSAVIPAAPATVAPAAVAGLVPTGGAGSISVAFTAYGSTATQIDIWLYGPHSAGRIPKIEKARHKVYGPGETSPVVISSLSPGLWTVFARAFLETNGLPSLFVMADATVT
jgi:hypothetical protein